ncbi:MAG: hypothetical protein H7A16_09680 [Sinobacteraceae bacterium]|nr:hypothetical protein [Nevskiaceae bacterium]
MGFANVYLTNLVEIVASGDLTVPAGGSPQLGDLYVVDIIYRDSVPFAVPAGGQTENLINTGDTTPVGGKPGLLQAWIVRGASAPDLTFTRTGGDMAAGRVSIYRPSTGQVHIVDSAIAESSSAGTTISIPSVTTAASGDLIHALGGAGRAVHPEPCSSTDPGTASGTGTDIGTEPTAGLWINRGSNTGTLGADYGHDTFDGVHSSVGSTGAISISLAASSHWAGGVIVFGDGPGGGGTTQDLAASGGAVADGSATLEQVGGATQDLAASGGAVAGGSAALEQVLGSVTLLPIELYTGTLLASETLRAVHFYDTSDNHVLTVKSVALDGSGIATINNAALLPGTQYDVDVVRDDLTSSPGRRRYTAGAS